MSNIQLYEIGPRDWRFSHRRLIETQVMADTIEMIVKAGLKRVEIGASVNYANYPHIDNSFAILAELRQRQVDGEFAIYVGPGQRNYPSEKIRELMKKGKLQENTGMPDILAFSISASEERNWEIFKMTQDKTIFQIKKHINRVDEDNKKRQLLGKKPIATRGYVSAAFGYNDKDDVSAANVIGFCELLFDFGCSEVALGDTRGNASPEVFENLWEKLWPYIERNRDRIAIHFHEHNYFDWEVDIARVIEKYRIRRFDTSIIDLPAPKRKLEDKTLIDARIPPNASTLKMVEYLKQIDYDTGIDYGKIKQAHEYIRQKLNL